MLRFALCFLLMPLSALAEVEFGAHTVFETRFGTLQVTGEGANRLLFDGREVPLPTGAAVTIRAGYGRSEEAFDYVLIGQGSGGRACPPPVTVLRVAAGEVRLSQPMGACVREVLDIRVLPGRIEIDLPGSATPPTRRIFTFDGSATTERLADRQVVSPEADFGVARYVGDYAGDFYSNPALSERLSTIMPQEAIDRLFVAASVGGPMVQRGEWVIATGCMPHNCDRRRGLIAIRIGDGAAGAAILFRDRPSEIYGAAATDAILRAAVAEHAP